MADREALACTQTNHHWQRVNKNLLQERPDIWHHDQETSLVIQFFWTQHLYSVRSKLVLRRGGPRIWPVDWGVSPGGLVPGEHSICGYGSGRVHLMGVLLNQTLYENPLLIQLRLNPRLVGWHNSTGTQWVTSCKNLRIIWGYNARVKIWDEFDSRNKFPGVCCIQHVARIVTQYPLFSHPGDRTLLATVLCGRICSRSLSLTLIRAKGKPGCHCVWLLFLAWKKSHNHCSHREIIKQLACSVQILYFILKAMSVYSMPWSVMERTDISIWYSTLIVWDILKFEIHAQHLSMEQSAGYSWGKTRPRQTCTGHLLFQYYIYYSITTTLSIGHRFSQAAYRKSPSSTANMSFRTICQSVIWWLTEMRYDISIVEWYDKYHSLGYTHQLIYL